MYFTLIKRDKEISMKAKELDGYYTAEFAQGYMMTHYTLEWILDHFIVGIPILVIIGFIIFTK